MKTKVVIGAGYGDEGKGVTVDALVNAAQTESCVVRFNGGAQAGHSVQKGGKRHVFHHIGSGALSGARTHLSRHFIHHPLMLLQEAERVIDLGGRVQITADPLGRITTPWDVAVNQTLERLRSRQKHGSCGMGFGETVGRCEDPDSALTIRHLFTFDLRDRLEHIRSVWFPKRMQDLLGDDVSTHMPLWTSQTLRDRFEADLADFCRLIAPARDEDLQQHKHLVFEGAQGLGLDQDLGHFPHVTRSHTGLPNVMDLAQRAGLDELDVRYVTRCYATRHGAGPFERENERLTGVDVVDDTNRPNAWQDSLRTAPLDIDTLFGRIDADLKRTTHNITVHSGLVVTCLDQIHTDLLIGNRREPARHASQALARMVGQPLVGEGWGAETDLHRVLTPADGGGMTARLTA